MLSRLFDDTKSSQPILRLRAFYFPGFWPDKVCESGVVLFRKVVMCPYFCTMPVKRYGFGRKEKLKSRKQIDELFLNGKSFSTFPLRVTYQFLPAEEPMLQVGVTAGKKYFKKAVDRNRIKRLIREAYRLQKNDLTEILKQKGNRGFLFFVYTDRTIASFTVVKEAMSRALKRLENLVESNENPS